MLLCADRGCAASFEYGGFDEETEEDVAQEEGRATTGEAWCRSGSDDYGASCAIG